MRRSSAATATPPRRVDHHRSGAFAGAAGCCVCRRGSAVVPEVLVQSSRKGECVAYCVSGQERSTDINIVLSRID